jgi:uncharacterized protein YhbP (UPF0306 family)
MSVTPQGLAQEYLPSVNVLQLATCVGNKPYVVNVHYYSDDKGRLYWISSHKTRHSKELKENHNACAVIKVHENTTTENWIIGLTIEGTVEYLAGTPGEAIAEAYQAKLDKPQKLMDGVRDGTTEFGFYRLNPVSYSLFDTKNFPKDPKQEWSIV